MSELTRKQILKSLKDISDKKPSTHTVQELLAALKMKIFIIPLSEDSKNPKQ